MIAQEVSLLKKPEVKNEDFITTLRELSGEYLVNHKGFINRFYAKKNDEEWLLFVFFDSIENAHDCIDNYYKWNKSGNLLGLLREGGLVLHHYKLLEGLI